MTIRIPDVAPRLKPGEILDSKYLWRMNAYWVMYMGKIYGVDHAR